MITEIVQGNFSQGSSWRLGPWGNSDTSRWRLISGKLKFSRCVFVNRPNQDLTLQLKMSHTHMTNFQDAVAQYCVQCVLHPLSLWLVANKNCQVSTDEMMAALQIPSSARVAIPMSNTSSSFNTPAGASAPVASSSKAKKSATAAADYNGPTCTYKFIRGVRKDHLCGEPCLPGEVFCKQCFKKKSGGNGGTNSGGAATSSSTGGFVNNAKSSQAPAQQDVTVNVQPIKDRPGFFRSTDDNIILQQLPNGDVVARGIEENGVTRRLTAEERASAEKRGFSVDDAESSPAATPAPTSAVPPMAAATLSRPVVIPRSH